ncbi:MAG: hypothetical protein KDK08_01850 [Rhizobiaceae bacterium]|nr:hypothetical protein [Rhizobiaceae bacterium]
MTPTQDQLSHELDRLKRELADVLEPLTGDELFRATTQAIVKHRNLVEQLDLAYHALHNVAEDNADREKLIKAYSDAMLNNRAQVAVVSALTDKLGYIPEIPQKGHKDP